MSFKVLSTRVKLLIGMSIYTLALFLLYNDTCQETTLIKEEELETELVQNNEVVKEINEDLVEVVSIEEVENYIVRDSLENELSNEMSSVEEDIEEEVITYEEYNTDKILLLEGDFKASLKSSKEVIDNQILKEELLEQQREEELLQNNKFKDITLDEDDYYYLYRCIETEVYQEGLEARKNVCSVILNRYLDGSFGSSVKKIITSPYQFAYGRKKIDDLTKQAVEEVLKYGDTVDGCLFFNSHKPHDKTFCGRKYQFTDEAGHSFFK